MIERPHCWVVSSVTRKPSIVQVECKTASAASKLLAKYRDTRCNDEIWIQRSDERNRLRRVRFPNNLRRDASEPPEMGDLMAEHLLLYTALRFRRFFYDS